MPTDLDSARSDFEASWNGLRRSMNDKLGLRVRRSGWWILLLAGAVGVALGSRSRGRPQDSDEGA